MGQEKQILKFIQKGDLKAFSSLIQANPDLANGKTSDGISLLSYAAYCGQKDIVASIEKHKSEISVFEAAILGDLEKLIAHLAKTPSLLNTYSTDGFTLIGLASFFSHDKVVAELIRLGADVNKAADNAFRVSPLHSACAVSNVELAELLILNGANINAKQQYDVRPLHSAAHNGHLVLTRTLLKYGADSSAKTSLGKTALDMAIASDFKEIVTLLSSN